MNRGEVLTKAIAIAKRNGFQINEDFFTEIPVENWLRENQNLYYNIICTHDFAFYFFGDHCIVVEELEENAEELDLTEYEYPMILLMSNRKNIKIKAWQYHLTQMMLNEDPLSYINKFVQDYEQAQFN